LLGTCAVAFLASIVPAVAADATLAPADEYFGRFNLSVLAIANSIRDCGARLDAGADPRDVIAGPLTFATDAMHAWEARYPSDPWIAKDLLALETVYLKIPSDAGARLASRTEAWLVADFPESAQAARGRDLLAQAPDVAPASPANAWERFAALRVPLPPR
jgi:hypothetical protein